RTLLERYLMQQLPNEECMMPMADNKRELFFPISLVILMGLSIFLCEFGDSAEEVSSAKRYSGTIAEVGCTYRSSHNRSHINFTLDDNNVLFFRVVGLSCDQIYAANLLGSSTVAYYTRGFAWQVDVNN